MSRQGCPALLPQGEAGGGAGGLGRGRERAPHPRPEGALDALVEKIPGWIERFDLKQNA
jgi:hypothetical protein